MDHYLRFDNRAQAMSALEAVETTSPIGSVVIFTAVEHMTIDVIGELYASVNHSPVPIPGWHMNLRDGDLPEHLAAYCVTPEPPRRVWA